MKSVTKLTIRWEREEPGEDDLGMALEYIVGLIKDGYTSGYASGNIRYWELR